MMRKAVIARSTREFSPRVRFHYQRDYVGRDPADEQIRVSGIREDGELYGRGHPQGRKDLIPKHLVLRRGR